MPLPFSPTRGRDAARSIARRARSARAIRVRDERATGEVDRRSGLEVALRRSENCRRLARLRRRRGGKICLCSGTPGPDNCLPRRFGSATQAVGTLRRECAWFGESRRQGGEAFAAEKAKIAVRVDPLSVASIIPLAPLYGADAEGRRRMNGNVAAAAALFASSRGESCGPPGRRAVETGRKDPVCRPRR